MNMNVEVKKKKHVFTVPEMIGISILIFVLVMGLATFIGFAGGAKWGTADFGFLMFLGITMSGGAIGMTCCAIADYNAKVERTIW